MTRMALLNRSVAVAAGIVVCGAVGLGAGTALAIGLSTGTPAGVTVGEGIEPSPLPMPTYSTNESGMTFGSVADAISSETEPDLILVMATNGVTGYVKKVDLDWANGTTAAQSFRSPDDAAAWQATEGQKDHTIPVYDVDGKSQIGEFTVVGQETIRRDEALRDEDESR